MAIDVQTFVRDLTAFPKLFGRLDLSTGRIVFQGHEFEWLEWHQFCSEVTFAAHQKFAEGRDLASDMQNLPGRKPDFVDDWFGVLPEFIPPPLY